MNIERLRQLRRVVEAAPDHRFHMRTFCEKAECGTAYCAAGWAAVDPWFRENTEIAGIFNINAQGYLYESDDVSDVFRELGHIFEIGDDDAVLLFGGDLSRLDEPHAVAKAEVLANIDRLIAGEAAQPYDVVVSKKMEAC